jgi:hypothetical protein
MNVQVDVATAAAQESAEPEPERINPTLWDSIRVVDCLSLFRFDNLLWREVTVFELRLQLGQRDTIPNSHGIYDIPKTLRHLAAVRIANQRVQVNRIERELSSKISAKAQKWSKQTVSLEQWTCAE